MNGKKPLTLDFNTFTTSTGLDYNNGTYVSHPSPEVLSGNYSSTEQVNSIQQLITYSLITRTKDENFGYLPGILSNSSFSKDLFKVIEIELTAHIIAVNNQKDSVFLVPLSIKKKKGKTQTVTPTLPKSYGPEASGSLSKKRKQPKPQKTPSETKVSSPKPTEDSEQSYSVSSGTVPDPQDLERNIQLVSMGLPSTLDEGTRKLQPLLKGTTIDPKDLGGNDQPTDKGLPSTASNEGMAKTTLCPEGPLRDKDSRGNKPPADMEPINPTVADPSGTSAKYQVDHTQSTKLRYQSLTKNEALLISDDERVQESDEEEVFEAGEDMDEDTQADTKVQSPPPNWTQHKEAAIFYADLKASIEGFYEENIDHNDQTNKVIDAAMNSFDKNSIERGDILNALNGATEALKANQDAVKEGHREGKAIVTDDQPEDQRKLVPASKEIQAHLDKEEKIKKAAEEAKMFEMTKTEVIKVVPEEAKKIGLYPKKIISVKAGEKFKKAQDAEHQVLKREHSQKAKRAIELRMKSLLKMNDIHKFGVYSLVSYLVMASMVKNQENSMFGLKLRKLIAEHPDQEKLQSKKVKLEALGYKLD
ncbi:hypothetical protein Tco_1043196 [Tanacetum coccineum]|uniref:Uncharacterized protein n=1 Tax=Tanacetum coccineum TaxID=301880 RepID=A0ABQ5GLC2_9ASTR